MRFSSSSLSVAALLGMASPAMSQQLRVGDPLEDYVRLLQLIGKAQPASLTIRPVSLETAMAWLPADVTNLHAQVAVRWRWQQ